MVEWDIIDARRLEVGEEMMLRGRLRSF